ncbi:3486_t:CDS:2 [Ambispora gerdemannii]|uniref:3486_t:CDS:1 n=1 Tax=Ambispora gerdemannii TaxID=144530 RepID=A0A9N8YQD4_9GLOM|nr:3486_t:CDS:2 [Ambispora gerdemannii]
MHPEEDEEQLERLHSLHRLLQDVEKTRRKIAQDCLVRIFQKNVAQNTVVRAQKENSEMIETFEYLMGALKHEIMIQAMKADLSPTSWPCTLNELFPVFPNGSASSLEKIKPLHSFHLLRPYFIRLFSVVEDFIVSQLYRQENRTKSVSLEDCPEFMKAATKLNHEKICSILIEYLDLYHDHIKEMSEYVNPIFEEIDRRKVMDILDQVTSHFNCFENETLEILYNLFI